MPLASFWVWACMPCNSASLFPGSALNPRGLTLWAACSRLLGHLDSVWTPLMGDSGRRFEGGGTKQPEPFPSSFSTLGMCQTVLNSSEASVSSKKPTVIPASARCPQPLGH